MEKRKTYDTRVKYLVKQGLLPDVYRKQIHRSLISKWKKLSAENFVGYELNGDLDKLYDLMKNVSNDQTMQKALRSFYRINKTLKDIIGTGKEYSKKIKEHKYQIVDAVSRCKNTIGIGKAIKLVGISKSTFRTWSMEAFFNCGQSITKLCNNAYPQQLTVKEIHKMHKLLVDPRFLHWPIISLAYYAMKKSMLKAHPNTWYKYVKLMNIKRKRRRKYKPKYEVGIRAIAPNEKWHADITEFVTSDGLKSYIYLVVDNFSRYITSWRVAYIISGQIRLETFTETIERTTILPSQGKDKTTSLIVDGGKENNNEKVERFIDKYPIEKLVALKDILKSNSMIESVNKIIKYDYLFPKHIENQAQLINYMRDFVIPDYNDKRPHGSLKGLTPKEAYRSVKVNFKKIREQMIEAYRDRVCYNQSYSCVGCPFGCKD